MDSYYSQEATRDREVGLLEWRCKTCKSPLMATESGSVCPNGCGRLMPKMPAAVRRINHAILLGVGAIANRWGHYYLEDGTEVALIKQVNREIKPQEVQRIGIHANALWSFKPVNKNH